MRKDCFATGVKAGEINKIRIRVGKSERAERWGKSRNCLQAKDLAKTPALLLCLKKLKRF